MLALSGPTMKDYMAEFSASLLKRATLSMKMSVGVT